MYWNFLCLFKSTKLDYRLNTSKNDAEKILLSKIDLMDGSKILPHYVFGYRDRLFSGFLDDGNFSLKSNSFRYKNSWRPKITGSIVSESESTSTVHIKISMHIFVKIFTLFFFGLGLFMTLSSIFKNLLSGLPLFLILFVMFGIVTGIYSFEENKIIKTFEKIFALQIVKSDTKI
jgi:hypothetical protein